MCPHADFDLLGLGFDAPRQSFHKPSLSAAPLFTPQGASHGEGGAPRLGGLQALPESPHTATGDFVHPTPVHTFEHVTAAAGEMERSMGAAWAQHAPDGVGSSSCARDSQALMTDACCGVPCRSRERRPRHGLSEVPLRRFDRQAEVAADAAAVQ